MRKLNILVAALAMTFTAAATEPTGYYSTCEGKTGEQLLSALHDVIEAGHTYAGASAQYKKIWEMYLTSDNDGTGKLIDIYSTKHWSYQIEQCGYNGLTSSHIGDCYAREHSFPKSWFNDQMPMYADGHHLYPVDQKVNGQRSNYPYGECANGTTEPDHNGYAAQGKLGPCTFPGYNGKVFEPIDEYKGDLARTYFYMATRYYDVIASWNGTVSASNKTDMLTYGQQFPAFQTWAINLLLKWHRQDPVSQKELDRNEAVADFQGNRNPFIDHPELAEYIYGTKVGTPWNLNVEPVPVINQPIHNSTVDCGDVRVGDFAYTSVPVKGSLLTEPLMFTICNSVAGYSPMRHAPARVQATETTYSFNFAEPTSLTPAYDMSNGTVDSQSSAHYYEVDGVGFTSDPVTICANKETGNSPRLWCTAAGATTYRVYKNSTFTVSTSEGNITAITFNVKMNGTPNTGAFDSTSKNWTGSAQSVTFTMTGGTNLSTVTVTVTPSEQTELNLPATPVFTPEGSSALAYGSMVNIASEGATTISWGIAYEEGVEPASWTTASYTDNISVGPLTADCYLWATAANADGQTTAVKHYTIHPQAPTEITVTPDNSAAIDKGTSISISAARATTIEWALTASANEAPESYTAEVGSTATTTPLYENCCLWVRASNGSGSKTECYAYTVKPDPVVEPSTTKTAVFYATNHASYADGATASYEVTTPGTAQKPATWTIDGVVSISTSSAYSTAANFRVYSNVDVVFTPAEGITLKKIYCYFATGYSNFPEWEGSTSEPLTIRNGDAASRIQALMVEYTIGEGEGNNDPQQPEPTANAYTKVTSATSINTTDHYILVGKKTDNTLWAMTDIPSGMTYVEGREVTDVDGVITLADNTAVQYFTLVATDTQGIFYIKMQNGKYLAATSFTNTAKLALRDTAETATPVTIADVEDDDTWQITFRGASSENDKNIYLRFNGGTDPVRFGNYSSQKDCYIYRAPGQYTGSDDQNNDTPTVDQIDQATCFTIDGGSTFTMSAAEALDGSSIDVKFAPTAVGAYNVKLLVTSGDCRNVVNLTGCGVAGLHTMSAEDIAQDCFTARWIDIDNAAATYMLYVCNAEGEPLEGYPVVVNSGAARYVVTGLEPNTLYKYYLTHGTAVSNVTEVTTAEAYPEIVVSLPSDAEYRDNYGELVGLRLEAHPNSVSAHAKVMIDVANVSGEMEVSIAAPFEVSTDTETWSNDVEFNPAQSHVYLRLGHAECGHYNANLQIKAGFVPNASAEGPARAKTNGKWSYLHDDFSVYGFVDQTITGTDKVESLDPWDAYSVADNTLTIDNRTGGELEVWVYTFEGYEVAALRAPAGLSNHKLPYGFYVVVAGNEAVRLLVK